MSNGTHIIQIIRQQQNLREIKKKDRSRFVAKDKRLDLKSIDKVYNEARIPKKSENELK